MSYRVECTNLKNELTIILHFSELFKAEKFLKNYGRLIEIENNLIPSQKRFGTIWESNLITKN